MLLILVAMALMTAGVENDEKKHHVEMAFTCLSERTLKGNNNTVGFRGNKNSKRNVSLCADVERRSEAPTNDGARHGNAFQELRVQGLEAACEKSTGELRGRGVQVSMQDEFYGVRVQVLRKRNMVNASDVVEPVDFDKLACEKCSNAGAARIQHRSVPETMCSSGNGALVMEMYVDEIYDAGSCCELAIWNNSHVLENVSFEPYVEFCMATLNMQLDLVGCVMDYVKEPYMTAYDFLRDFDSIKFKELCATGVAMVIYVMRHFLDLMTVESMWTCWLVTLAACYALSHLGLGTRTSGTNRWQKRQCGALRHQQKLQLKAILFASWAYHSQAMQAGGEAAGEQAFLQRMSTLAEAATSAATAVERALNMMANVGAPSSSSGAADATQSGLSMASRILKNPETFSGDDPHGFPAWKFNFCSWISFGDSRYQKAFEEVEKLKGGEELKPYSPDEQDLSTKLYAVLTSYLRGRCMSLVRNFAKTKDGFRLWKALVTEFEPPSRQRSLAVAQALASYPSFSSSKSALENVLLYEALVQQFEQLSGQCYPEELKAATLIRCSEARLREHLQLTVGETTSYSQLREAVLGFEKASKSWTTEAVLKSLNAVPENANNNANNGPAPMDVDRIYNEKGKSYKGKGKSKSKSKSWWSFGSYGFAGRGRGGRGKGRGNKGKGKGKSKEKNKGKSKDGGKKGGRKGKQVDAQQCRLCLEYGHWSRECPNRMTQQVTNNAVPPQAQAQQQQQPAQVGQARSPPPSSTYPPTSSTASSIRRIYGIPASMTSSSNASVRTVSGVEKYEEKNVVILDSGSDVSLLPLSCVGVVDGPADESQVRLRDCQGQELKVAGIKTASLVVEDSDGTQAGLETQFLVADNIKSAILSLGQLYRAGWSVAQSDDGPRLQSPDQTLNVPVFYVRNSLAIQAEVLRIESTFDELDDVPMVRAVVELNEKFRPEILRNNMWETNVDGNPYMRSVGEHFIDPVLVWPSTFKYRTTLIQKRSTSYEDHGWCVVEVSRRFLEMGDPFGRIAEVDSYANGEPVTILTIFSKSNQSLYSFGDLLDQGGLQLDIEYEPGTPLGAEDVGDVEGADIGDGAADEALQGRDIPEYQQLAPALRDEETAERIVVGEEPIYETSSIEKLRRAARYLRVSSSGSKKKIFQKIREAHVTGLRMQALEAARQEYEAMDPTPRFADAPKQPSAMERKMHEVTHLPFRSWCAFCVQAKPRGDYKKRSTAEERSNRSFPTVQTDLFMMSSGMAVLLMVDEWTKYIGVEPLRNRNAGVIGAVLARFCSSLSLFDVLEVAFDNEPVLSAGVKMAQSIRAAQGLPLNPQPGKLYSKGRTSLAERSIQTVRSQAKCLIAFLEHKMALRIPESHVLQGWSFVHAAWLLNRYHLSSSTGVTAFMAVRGRPYKGRVCAFGEEVFALDSLQQKYQCQWGRGCWLTKDEADHDIVAVGAREVLRSKAVRKIAEHWDASFLIGLEIGPWDLKRGVQTVVQQAKPMEQPLPQLHVSFHGVEAEGDVDERAVKQYAKDHPNEDVDEVPGDGQEGGAPVASIPPHGLQDIGESHPEMPDEEMNEMIAAAEKRDREGDQKLPLPGRPRIADPEATKRTTGSAASTQAKFEIELYDEDELADEVPLESWDWDINDQLLDGDFSNYEISSDEKARRGFNNEDAGPPQVSAEELAFLDKNAMYVELDRLRALDVIGDVQDGIDVSQALHLDTKLVRDWRFRNGCWTRRARMVAREFRGQSAPTEETFSPTTPLMLVKVLMVIGLVKRLMLSALDVSDAFLQVLQKEHVVVSVPNWVKVAANDVSLMFWQLKKCLPGQRNAATRWNDHLTQLLDELNFENMQGTIFRHREREIYISAHIDDLLLVANRADTEEIYAKLSEKLTLKKDGPYGIDEPGRLFYLERQIDVSDDGIDITPNSKYIPKLAEMLGILERRGKTVPHHNALVVFDAETIAMEEYLDGNDAKLFRSALGICLYLAQERLDIQHTVRVLASYMGRPTKTALCALRKLGSYLVQTQDMKMHYPMAETFATTLTRWHGVEETRDGKPYEIELYSDSDWASCKITRRSTSSGLIFVNSCCVHSYSRAQMSISLSSMEAEILAATSLLVEGIQLKQLLQVLLGDKGGLSNNAQIQMRLRLDSTSAQSFFNRLGPGRAKHLSTRLLWSQQAMRRKWFLVERVATRENPADLNTKPLSRERREFLMQRIGLCSSTFAEEETKNVKVKQIVRMVTAMLMSTNLQGCDGPMSWTSSMMDGWLNPTTWTPTAWWTVTTIFLASAVIYLLNKINKLNIQMAKYKDVWSDIRSTLELQDQEDPFVQDALPDARQEPFSGIWYNQEASEEESHEDDALADANEGAPDREVPPQPPRICLQNGTHGAAEGDHGDVPSEHGAPAELSIGAVPTTEEGIAAMTEALGEIMDGAEEHAHGHGPEADEDEDDEEWSDESPQARYRRYIQSGQEEVSDPDEWADIHYGPASSVRSRSRSGEDHTPASSSIPVARSMPRPLAEQRDRRLAEERAEAMVRRAEEQEERRGATRSGNSKGSKGAKGKNTEMPHGFGDDENFFQDSLAISNYYQMGLVPREYAAFEDFRWDLIMQGMGPETILVHCCREVSNESSRCSNPLERARMQRLNRSLQSLLVMCQSKNPNLWIDAAYNVMRWLQSDREWTFFELDSAEGGSRHEEGEEESQNDDDEIDPQDRRPIPDESDADGDGGEPGEGAASSSMRGTWDYED
eukprot:s2238_g12.t1